MAILHELLVGEKNFNAFMRQHLFQAPFASARTAGQFEGLVSWDMLAEIFALHDDCWLPKFGVLPEESSLNKGRLKVEQARLEFAKGRTVLVRHAEKSHPSMAGIADDFRALFEKPVDVHLYVTPASQEGFGWHYDVEDVFVIQSQGEKEFRLLANTVSPRPLPVMNRDNFSFHLEKKSPEIRCLLKAGDWLYIPAGYWHKARAVTDSFHLSVGVLCQAPAAVAETVC